MAKPMLEMLDVITKEYANVPLPISEDAGLVPTGKHSAVTADNPASVRGAHVAKRKETRVNTEVMPSDVIRSLGTAGLDHGVLIDALVAEVDDLAERASSSGKLYAFNVEAGPSAPEEFQAPIPITIRVVDGAGAVVSEIPYKGTEGSSLIVAKSWIPEHWATDAEQVVIRDGVAEIPATLELTDELVAVASKAAVRAVRAKCKELSETGGIDSETRAITEVIGIAVDAARDRLAAETGCPANECIISHCRHMRGESCDIINVSSTYYTFCSCRTSPTPRVDTPTVIRHAVTRLIEKPEVARRILDPAMSRLTLMDIELVSGDVPTSKLPNTRLYGMTFGCVVGRA